MILNVQKHRGEFAASLREASEVSSDIATFLIIRTSDRRHEDLYLLNDAIKPKITIIFYKIRRSAYPQKIQ